MQQVQDDLTENRRYNKMQKYMQRKRQERLHKIGYFKNSELTQRSSLADKVEHGFPSSRSGSHSFTPRYSDKIISSLIKQIVQREL